MSRTAHRPSLRDEQKALTRRRLIDAGEAVFARSGYHGASVEEIAREAGASTGALYSNFAGKEDLFLALFEERVAADVRDYSQIAAEGATVEEQARGPADHWMEILRERPDYFPLFIEFWAYAIREPRFRSDWPASSWLCAHPVRAWLWRGRQQQGVSLSAEAGELVGILINALANGLALEKLADPDAVPDSLFGDMLVLIFQALEALARENPGIADQGGASRSQEQQPTRRKAAKMSDSLQTAGRDALSSSPLADPSPPISPSPTSASSGNRGGCPALEDDVGGGFRR